MPETETLILDAPPAGRASPTAERQLEMLGRLAEAGLELAIGLESQAKGGRMIVVGDIAVAYARVARAVRQTIMLQSTLMEARQERRTAQANRRASARSDACRLIGRAIQDAAVDQPQTDRLSREAAERLELEDFSDFLSRPFGQAVAEICKALGLSPDWLILADDCALAEAALTGKPAPGEPPPEGAPFELRWLNEDDDDP